MTAEKQEHLVLVEPSRGTLFDKDLMRTVAAIPLHVEFASDEKHLHQSISALADSGETFVVVCPPLSKMGSAAEVLYGLRTAGLSAAFVGYGDFRKDMLADLLRLGADDVLMPPVSAEGSMAALTRAADRGARRLQYAQANVAGRQQIIALKNLLHEKEGQFAAVCRLTIESLMLGLAVRETDAIPHSLRVQAYAGHLARVAGYPEQMCEALEQAALLHDIGKIGISEEVLFRQGWLTQPELQELEPHVEFGARIIERFDFLRAIAPIVQHHHERFDGHGFPGGLVGNAIPLGARVFAIADSLDAMTSDKPYRAAMAFEVATEEIQRNAGKQFDPKLVEHFLKVDVATWANIRERVMRSLRGQPPLFFFPSTTSIAPNI